MKIIRDGKEYVLTSEELERAYREQKHNYLLSDAESQFNDYLQRKFDSVECFEFCFGLSADAVCDPSSEQYLLEKFVRAYENYHDCEQAENDMWQEVVRNVLIENAVNVKITYAADCFLWDETNPSFWRRVTEAYPAGYKSVSELNAALPGYCAQIFERHGVRNGKVVVSVTIKKVRTIGSGNTEIRDCWCYKGAESRHATMLNGKLLFDDETVIL